MPIIGNLVSGKAIPYTKIQRFTAQYHASDPINPGQDHDVYTVPANTVTRIKLDYYQQLTGVNLQIRTQIVSLHSTAPSSFGVVEVHSTGFLNTTNKFAFELGTLDFFDPNSAFSSSSNVGGLASSSSTAPPLVRQGKLDPFTQELILQEGETLRFNGGASTNGNFIVSYIIKEQTATP